MNEEKMRKIKAAGVRVTDAVEWLSLTPEEAKLVEMRVALARELEHVRKMRGLTQKELADRMGTRQPGVARMLKHPETSSIDGLMKALMLLGEPISRIAACLLLCADTNQM